MVHLETSASRSLLGEEARLGVDGGTSLVEAELGLLGVVAREVSVEKCLDGTDILPVAIVEECLNVHAEVLGVGDDLTTEVVAAGEFLHKQLLHGPGVEDVDTHGRDVRHLLGALGIETEDGGVHRHRLEGVALGLLGEVDDLAGVINLHEAERRGALLIHGHGGDGDVSLGLAMLQDEGLVVHAVEVITGKDDVLVALGLVEEPDVLAHSICGALEPVLVLGRLLRGEHLDETLAVVGADVVVVRLRKVSVERGGVELREAVHLVDVGVDAVGHGQVDEPVVGAKGNRGLGAGLGERIQAGARTTAEDDAEDILRYEEDTGVSLAVMCFSGARGVSDTEGKIWRTEKGRSNSRTHVGVVVDFGGGLSGDLSLGGDGTGHALHLHSGGWYGRGFESERCSRFAIGCPRGLRVPGEEEESPLTSAFGTTRRDATALPRTAWREPVDGRIPTWSRQPIGL